MFVAASILLAFIVLVPGVSEACLRCSADQDKYCEDLPWWGVFQLGFHECTIRTLCPPNSPVCFTECWGTYQCTFWDIIT